MLHRTHALLAGLDAPVGRDMTKFYAEALSPGNEVLILRRVTNKKQRPSGEEVRRALLVLINNWEEECCRSHQGALGGGVRCPEVVLNINPPIGNG